MTTEEYSPEDRASWGEGPWQQEPARVEWRHAGLPCLIRRSPDGALCGYVAVFPGHPLHGRPRAEIDLDLDQRPHGGVTWARGPGDRHTHVPEPGERTDVWWIGFDCAHGNDCVPAFANLYQDIAEQHSDAEPLSRHRLWLEDRTLRERRKQYRNIEFVTTEVNKLAEQLARFR